MAVFECEWCLEYFELKDGPYMANIDLFQCKYCYNKITKRESEQCGLCLKKRKRMEGKAYCEDCNNSIIIPQNAKSKPDEIEKYNLNYSPYQFRCKGPPNYFPDDVFESPINYQFLEIGAFAKLMNSLEAKDEVKLIEGVKNTQ